MKFLNLRESKRKQTDLAEDIHRRFWKKSGSKRKKGEFEIELEEEIKSLEEKITLLTEQSKKTLLRSKKQKKGIVMESMRIMKDQVKDWTLTRDEEESMMMKKVMEKLKLKLMQTDPEDQDEPAGAVDGQRDEPQDEDEDDSCKPEAQIDQPKLTPKTDKKKTKKMTPIRKTIMKKATGKMTPKMTQMLMNEKLKKIESR